MKREQVEKVAMTFETMVNANVTVKFGTAIREAYLDNHDDYHFYVGAPSVIWPKDWTIINAFAHLNQLCMRYNSQEAEWELW